MSTRAIPLVWGQRVRAAGSIGRYEGILCADRPDLLRVYFEEGSTGVVYFERRQLRAIPEHPVCLHRRLRAAGLRAPRRVQRPTPACYLKDYGPTAAQRAYAAWEQALENDDPELFGQLWDDMQRAYHAEQHPKRPRRLAADQVKQRREDANHHRWLRTRKALRALAPAHRSVA